MIPPPHRLRPLMQGVIGVGKILAVRPLKVAPQGSRACSNLCRPAASLLRASSAALRSMVAVPPRTLEDRCVRFVCVCV